MNKDVISELARQVVQQEFLVNWPYYLLLLALMLVITTVGTFAGSYFRRRGENFATKTDMTNLLDQLRKTTTATESIRSAISMGEWSTKEYRATRRMKLEELMTATVELDYWLERDRGERLFAEPRLDKPAPIQRVRILATLYFPELTTETTSLNKAYLQYFDWVTRWHVELLTLKDSADAAAYGVAVKKCQDEWAPVTAALNQATVALASRAAAIMRGNHYASESCRSP